METIKSLKSRLHGYVDETMLPEIVELNRLEQLVVRMAKCRFICAAQDAEYLIKTIERADPDNYCRDVSFLSAARHQV